MAYQPRVGEAQPPPGFGSQGNRSCLVCDRGAARGAAALTSRACGDARRRVPHAVRQHLTRELREPVGDDRDLTDQVADRVLHGMLAVFGFDEFEGFDAVGEKRGASPVRPTARPVALLSFTVVGARREPSPAGGRLVLIRSRYGLEERSRVSQARKERRVGHAARDAAVVRRMDRRRERPAPLSRGSEFIPIARCDQVGGHVPSVAALSIHTRRRKHERDRRSADIKSDAGRSQDRRARGARLGVRP